MAARTPPAPSFTAPVGAGRILWLDRLRIVLTGLVVAHHSADTYSSIADWYVAFGGHDPSATVLTVFMLFNQLFFMGMFFLLAGYLTPGAYDRHGAGRYTRGRLVRLGVPLLAYIVVIRPLCLLPGGLVKARHAAAGHQGFSLLHYIAFDGDPGVAWFLEVLVVFSLGYVGLRLLRGGRAARPSPNASRPRLAGIVTIALVLAALTLVWQWRVPLGAYWPVVGLPSPYFLPQYLVFFTVGGLAARHDWFATMPSWWALPAIPGMLAGAVLFAVSLASPIDPGHLLAGAEQAGGSALFAVSIGVVLLVCFRRWLNGPATRATRFLADQSFLVYLVHPLVLTWAAVAIMALDWPSIAWAALLFAFGAPLSWGLAWLLRRNRAIRHIT